MRVLKVLMVVMFASAILPTYAQLALNQPPNSSSALKQANKYFEKQAYQHSVGLYEKILADQPGLVELQIKVADCYRLLSDYHQASFWYQLAIESHSSHNKFWRDYAATLCRLEKYPEAIVWYRNYLQHNPNDTQAQAALNSIQNLKAFFNPRFSLQLLEINVNGPVYSPAIWQEGLVFVAPGNTGGVIKKVATWNESPYYDLYYTDLIKGRTGFPQYFSKKINSLYNEGPAVFYNKDERIIFTRNAPSKSSDKARKLQLWTSRIKPNGHWADPTSLNLNNADYSIGHPAINATGTVLYFVSDMPGGFGGTDIYKSQLLNGLWQKPVNLGPVVNSPGNEMFPHYNDGHLYFSSDGRGGLGGLDLFVCDLVKPTESKNLGFPMNSPQDDFGIVWQADPTQGYISSNRKGIDKIFVFRYQN